MACKLMSNVNKVASFSRLRNEHVPSNTLSRKGREIQHPLHREPPWMTNRLKNLINLRNRAHSRRQWDRLMQLRDLVRSEISSAKTQWYKQQMDKIATNKGASWYKQVSKLTNRQPKPWNIEENEDIGQCQPCWIYQPSLHENMYNLWAVTNESPALLSTRTRDHFRDTHLANSP